MVINGDLMLIRLIVMNGDLMVINGGLIVWWSNRDLVVI